MKSKISFLGKTKKKVGAIVLGAALIAGLSSGTVFAAGPGHSSHGKTDHAMKTGIDGAKLIIIDCSHMHPGKTVDLHPIPDKK